jgi:hypothetical protein
LYIGFPASTAVQAYTATLSAISVGTTTGRAPGSAPATVVPGRLSRRPASTQSTHW